MTERAESAGQVVPLRRGRPPKYSVEIADEILERVAGGESLTAICDGEGMPSRGTVARWSRAEAGAPLTFSSAYALAREHRAERLAEEVIAIADGAEEAANRAAARAVDEAGDAPDRVLARIARLAFSSEVQVRRLRCDVRRWAAAKLDPRRWGERVQHDIGGQASNPLVSQRAADQLSDDDREEVLRLSAKALQRSLDPADES